MDNRTPFILQIVGYKNTGKTTLICKLIERMKADELSVGVIKHDAHDFQMDHPGTDTWKHQSAGADSVAITSPNRTAWLSAFPTPLDDLVRQMGAMDIILVEGFKNALYPKLIMAKEAAHLKLPASLHNPIAVVLWPELRETVLWNEVSASGTGKRSPMAASAVDLFSVNQIEEIYRFIIRKANRAGFELL